MSYSSDIKPAKILNLPTLDIMASRLYLQKSNDFANYGQKSTANNAKRFVYTLKTSDVDIQPTLRPVITLSKKYTDYNCFLIESGVNATGIAVVMIKKNSDQSFSCCVEILPLASVDTITDKEKPTDMLTVNTEATKHVILLEIGITISNCGEPQYYTPTLSLGSIAEIISQDELTELKNNLEFHGAKIAAHFCQEIITINFKDLESSISEKINSDQYSLQVLLNTQKDLFTAMTAIGAVMIEIIGTSAIKDLNKDWTKASNFVGYLL
ncbi:MAG: hypothetical protein AAF611_00105 [Bacteroidota bacterium]